MPGITTISHAGGAQRAASPSTPAAPRAGQPTGLTSSPLPGPTSSRQAVIYAPFAAGDVVTQSLGKNLVREQNGKPLLPLIAQDDQAHVRLQQLQQQQVQDLRGKGSLFPDQIRKLQQQHNLSQDVLRQHIGPAEFDKAMQASATFARQADVLQRMEIRSNEHGAELGRLQPQRDKIYIVGHGGPGMDILAADQQVTQGKATSADVAQQLAAGGLDRAFRDFRATACFSADTREPTSFHPADLGRAAAPALGPRPGFLQLFGKRPVLSQPFAQSLSDELAKQGFKQPEVAGYHGAGVTFSQIGHSSRRLPGAADSRASELKQVFTPRK
ncbi:hypothetical protein [Chromobacterium subtsugae]|uniref:hypothetical protein n=1 Tax=Chromobacterium subtsugae TaxID=251747 RepID=UPI00069AB7CD|nr:hypothetical protein [Chromobacterium subtsugae]